MQRRGRAIDGLKFFDGFHIEHEDAGFKRQADFIHTFPHAGENNAIGRNSSPARAKEFARRNNIRSGARFS